MKKTNTVGLFCDSCGYKVYNKKIVWGIAIKGFKCPKCKEIMYVCY